MSPALTSNYNWLTGSTSPALPRTASDFLTAAFGPMTPMTPVPVDWPLPSDPSERPPPRRYPYPVGYNLPTGVPGSEGFKFAAFAALRAYADLYSVARACLDVRQTEIVSVEWDIVPTDDAAIAMRTDSAKAEDFQRRAKEAKAFFEKPDPDHYKSYHAWLRALLEDMFVCDAVSLYLWPARTQGKGVLGSDLAALALIDGTTVKPLVDARGGTPRPPSPAYQQFLYGVPRREFMDLLLTDDLEQLDTPATSYAGDQLLYLRYHPRTYSPYGFSLIEQCILPLTIGVSGQQYTLAFYREGSMPETYIVDGRPGVSPQQSYQLQTMLNATAGDLSMRRKAFVLPYNSRPIPMKPQAIQLGQSKAYAEDVCMVLGVSLQELGQSPGGSHGLGGKGFGESQENVTFRRANVPVLTWLKRELFDYVLHGPLNQHDMEWHWKGFEPAEDEQQKITTLLARVHGGEMAMDEMRVALGEDAWGTDLTASPHYFTGSGLISLEDGSSIAVQPTPPAPPAGAVPRGPNEPPPGGQPAKPTPGPTPEAPPGTESPLQQAQDATQQKPAAAATKGATAGDPPDGTAALFHRTLKKDLGSTSTPQPAHTGAMVALVPPPDIATALARPGGEPPAELHVTLAFLGQAADLPDPSVLLSAMRAFAQQHAPISATLNGTGRFQGVEDDSTDAVYVNVDAPTLPALRQALVELLTRLGYPPQTGHGYSPHCTIAYVPSNAPTPAWPYRHLPVTFQTLRVVLGDEVHDYPFSGALKSHTSPQSDAQLAQEIASAYLLDAKLLFPERRKYSPDQPRDPNGRFASGGGGEPATPQAAAEAWVAAGDAHDSNNAYYHWVGETGGYTEPLTAIGDRAEKDPKGYWATTSSKDGEITIGIKRDDETGQYRVQLATQGAGIDMQAPNSKEAVLLAYQLTDWAIEHYGLGETTSAATQDTPPLATPQTFDAFNNSASSTTVDELYGRFEDRTGGFPLTISELMSQADEKGLAFMQAPDGTMLSMTPTSSGGYYLAISTTQGYHDAQQANATSPNDAVETASALTAWSQSRYEAATGSEQPAPSTSSLLPPEPLTPGERLLPQEVESVFGEAYVAAVRGNLDQQVAVQAYTGTLYDPLNRALRDGQPLEGDTPTFARGRALLASMQPLPAGTTVYRGVSNSEWAGPELRDAADSGHPEALVGHTIIDKGFVSTTVDRMMGTSWSGGGGTLFQIDVPPGHLAAYPDGLSNFPQEKELILRPSTAFEITSAVYDSEKNRTIINARVVQ